MAPVAGRIRRLLGHGGHEPQPLSPNVEGSRHHCGGGCKVRTFAWVALAVQIATLKTPKGLVTLE